MSKLYLLCLAYAPLRTPQYIQSAGSEDGNNFRCKFIMQLRFDLRRRVCVWVHFAISNFPHWVYSIHLLFPRTSLLLFFKIVCDFPRLFLPNGFSIRKTKRLKTLRTKKQRNSLWIFPYSPNCIICSTKCTRGLNLEHNFRIEKWQEVNHRNQQMKNYVFLIKWLNMNYNKLHKWPLMW